VIQTWDEYTMLLFQDVATNESGFDTFFATTPSAGALYFGILTGRDANVGYSVELNVARVIPEPATGSLLAVGRAMLAVRRVGRQHAVPLTRQRMRVP